ncbi:MAG: P8 family protein [Leuconostoc mesenteroides]
MADEKFETLDLPMSEVFSWSEDKTPLRDALWNHDMDTSNKNTLETLKHLKAYENMSSDEVKLEAEKVLQEV